MINIIYLGPYNVTTVTPSVTNLMPISSVAYYILPIFCTQINCGKHMICFWWYPLHFFTSKFQCVVHHRSRIVIQTLFWFLYLMLWGSIVSKHIFAVFLNTFFFWEICSKLYFYDALDMGLSFILKFDGWRWLYSSLERRTTSMFKNKKIIFSKGFCSNWNKKTKIETRFKSFKNWNKIHENIETVKINSNLEIVLQ